MITKMLRGGLVASFLLAAAGAAIAQGKTAAPAAAPRQDPRVATRLDSLSYRYTLTSDNDYKLIPIQTGDGARTQLVYVNSNTESFGALEIREVLAPTMLLATPVSQAIATRLLAENERAKLGAFRTVAVRSGPNAGKQLVLFAVQIPADSDAETLRLAIRSAILFADRIEKEYTGKDDY